MIKQSNARFVKWSDGSMSLQLGSEMFDVQTKQTPDTFLTMSRSDAEILQTTSLLTHSMTFVPYSTKSSTHIRLTNELKKMVTSNMKTVGNFATTDDPEKTRLEALRAEEATMKAKKKLEAKRRMLEDKESGYDSRGGSFHSSRPGSSSGGISRYATEAYNDEDDDGFVVEDDEEEEEPMRYDDDDDEDEIEAGANRLKDLKKKGAQQYKSKKSKRKHDDDDDIDDEFEDLLPELENELDEDEEEEEAKFTDEEEDEGSSSKKSKSKSKKRRIIDDDDEEDDY